MKGQMSLLEFRKKQVLSKLHLDEFHVKVFHKISLQCQIECQVSIKYVPYQRLIVLNIQFFAMKQFTYPKI